MGRPRVKLGVLTSSRADYGIYQPLLRKIKDDTFFDLEIIAFGMHLSKFHGETINMVRSDGHRKLHEIESLVTGDDEKSIALSYANTAHKFALFWSDHHYDRVLCLGDRFEMSAAVQAGIPFGVKFAHLHGGETTEGAIDNIYRHQITMASCIHFTSTDAHKEKVKTLTGHDDVYTVGSLSLDELGTFTQAEKSAFYKKYDLPDQDFALVTFHPETVSASENLKYIQELRNAMKKISEKIHLVITMPNADTRSMLYRELWEQLKDEFRNRITLVENFGKEDYFSAMTYARLLIGNSSSGIIEAASFGKYAVNVGNRQAGRVQSANVLNCGFAASDLVNCVNMAIGAGDYRGSNVYYRKNVADAMINILKGDS